MRRIHNVSDGIIAFCLELSKSQAFVNPLLIVYSNPTASSRVALSVDGKKVDLPQQNPIRIAILDHTARMGGGEIALLNLARSIDPARFKIIAILFSEGPLHEKLKASGIETMLIALDPKISEASKDKMGGSVLLQIRDIGTAIGFVRRLSQHLRDCKVDLVHTNSLKSDILGGLAARLAGVPVIWHVRDRIASDYLPRSVALIFRVLARVIPTKVVAISYAVLETLQIGAQPLMDSNESRFKVVHDGTEVGPLVEKSPFDTLLVGLVGRISHWKGQHIFLRAASQIRSQFPNARFQIIGSALFSESEYEGEIRALCSSLGLDDVVQFTGFRDDVGNLVANLDLLVHASTKGEPFGQVILEGMAAGKAVVATRGGGVPEFVVDGITGLLVPMGDVDAMARAMSKLLANENLRSEMGHRAHQSVIDGFTIERTAGNIQQVYEKVYQAGH